MRVQDTATVHSPTMDLSSAATILVLDRDPLVGMAVMMALSDRGYHVVTWLSPHPMPIDLLELDPPQAAVIDPGADAAGLSAVRWFDERHLPVLLHSLDAAALDHPVVGPTQRDGGGSDGTHRDGAHWDGAHRDSTRPNEDCCNKTYRNETYHIGKPALPSRVGDALLVACRAHATGRAAPADCAAPSDHASKRQTDRAHKRTRDRYFAESRPSAETESHRPAG